MIDITGIFDKVDSTALTISLAFFGTYTGIYFSLFLAVGDLRTIRTNAIYSIYNNNNKEHPKPEISEFIDMLYAEDKVLVLEPSKNYPILNIVLTLYGIVSLVTIFSESLRGMKFYVPPREILLVCYVVSLTLAVLFLYYEIKYYKAYRGLERKYTNSRFDKLIVCHMDKCNRGEQSAAPDPKGGGASG